MHPTRFFCFYPGARHVDESTRFAASFSQHYRRA
jgi:hypothetical protein